MEGLALTLRRAHQEMSRIRERMLLLLTEISFIIFTNHPSRELTATFLKWPDDTVLRYHKQRKSDSGQGGGRRVCPHLHEHAAETVRSGESQLLSHQANPHPSANCFLYRSETPVNLRTLELLISSSTELRVPLPIWTRD